MEHVFLSFRGDWGDAAAGPCGGRQPEVLRPTSSSSGKGEFFRQIKGSIRWLSSWAYRQMVARFLLHQNRSHCCWALLRHVRMLQPVKLTSTFREAFSASWKCCRSIHLQLVGASALQLGLPDWAIFPDQSGNPSNSALQLGLPDWAGNHQGWSSSLPISQLTCVQL